MTMNKKINYYFVCIYHKIYYFWGVTVNYNAKKVTIKPYKNQYNYELSAIWQNSHAPCVIDKLKELANTGCCEFLAETYSDGLSSLIDEKCFRDEIRHQCKKIEQLFGKTPSVFRNTGLIYSDEIGSIIADMHR